MTTYQFDTSQPYVLHINNQVSRSYLLYAALSFILGLVLPNAGMLLIILSIVLVYLAINKRRKKDKPIQIDRNGITPFEEKTILWHNISRCYFYNDRYSAYLKIILKNKDTVIIKLDDYAFKGEELDAAIETYAGKNIFGLTEDEKNGQLVILILILAMVIAFVVYLILKM